MDIRELFSDARFTRATIIACLVTAVILVFNFFVIGGDDFYNVSTNLVSPAAALLACFLFVRAVFVQKDSVAQKVWAGMALGFGLWAGADIIWTFYALVLHQEVPYPSIADLLWIGGYLPLYYALITRLRMLRLVPSRSQMNTIHLTSLIALLITALVVIRPIVADFDSSRLLGAIVNLLYPLGDLGLVIIAVAIMVLLREGRFSIAWRIILAGLVMMGVSDMLFSYATWQEIYLPDGHANFLSAFIDSTYALAYLISGFGIFVFAKIWATRVSTELRSGVVPPNRCYALLMVDKDGMVISASENIACILNATEPGSFTYRPLHQLLNIAEADAQKLLNQVSHQGLLSNMPLTIQTADLKPRQVWVTAMGIFDPENTYMGTNLSLRANLPVKDEQCLPTSRELLGILNYLLASAGSLRADESGSLRIYFHETMRMLSASMFQYGGARFQQAMFAELERVIKQKNLPIQTNGTDFTLPPELEGEQLASVIVPLLSSALVFAGDVVGEHIITDGLTDFEQRLTTTMQKDLEKYKIRLAYLGA